MSSERGKTHRKMTENVLRKEEKPIGRGQRMSSGRGEIHRKMIENVLGKT